MTRLTQIGVVFLMISWRLVDSKPLFESINIERKLNIDFKPLKFQPITFIKERWGPFGKFVKKHTIQRRDIEEFNTIDGRIIEFKPERLIPVIEKVEEPPVKVPLYGSPIQAVITDAKESPPPGKLNTDITSFLPAVPEVPKVPVVPAVPVVPVLPAIPGIPAIPAIPEIPAIPPIPPIPAIPLFTPAKKPEVEELGAVPIKETAPIEGPLIVPVKPDVKPEVPPPPPPPPAPPVEEPPLGFRGIARFFGDMLAEIFNRIIARARTSFFPNQTAQ